MACKIRDSYDRVVCIEMLEHLDAHDEVVRALDLVRGGSKPTERLQGRRNL